jgi:hypothetical protein
MGDTRGEARNYLAAWPCRTTNVRGYLDPHTDEGRFEMEIDGTSNGHEAAGIATGSNGKEIPGHSANGGQPETPGTGWRAEQQLIRLLTKTQRLRERLSQLRGRLAAAKSDDESAWAALDQERAMSDAEDRRFGSLLGAFAIAIGVSIIDLLPAYWAAQALGHGVMDTWLVTGILVAALTGVAWMMSHYRNKGSRGPFLAALVFTVVLILVEAGLRLDFLRTVNDATVRRAALEGAMLAGISGVLVWVGYMKLVDAEPYATWKRRRAANRASDDLKKLQIEYESTDTDYRQTLQALRLARFGSASRNPKLVDAVEDELAMSPPVRPQYESRMDRFIDATRPPSSAAPPDTEGPTQ